MFANQWANNISKKSVKDVMTRDVHYVGDADKFSTVKKLMKKHKIRHVPVVKDKKLVGIISHIDLLRYSFNEEFSNDQRLEDKFNDMNTPLKTLMTDNVISVSENSNVRVAAKLMVENSFNSLPVVNESLELVGIVTSKDLLKLIAQT